MNPSARIVQPIRHGRAYFEMVTCSSFSTGSRIPFRSNFKLRLVLLSSLSLPLSIFFHRTSLLVNGLKATPCSKRRTLLFQRLELRRRVRHMTVGRQFPIDRSRSSPMTSLIYCLGRSFQQRNQWLYMRS
jgi:hypothetical protein